MKKLMLIAALFFVSSQLFSQTFEVPDNYRLEEADDYAKYEEDVVAAVNWLIETPAGEQQKKRKEANAFILKWITGSPTVTIEVRENVVTFMDCADCLLIFMGGWTKYALENDDYTDKVKGTMAGIESVITFYKKNKNVLGKNKAIEKYIKMQDKDKLTAFVEENA